MDQKKRKKERRGRVKSRNMYKGSMDKDNMGKMECRRGGVGRARESNGGKWVQL